MRRLWCALFRWWAIPRPESDSSHRWRSIRSRFRMCVSSIVRIMKTLYPRNVPDEVARRLKVLADGEGISVSALAVRELAIASRRADHPALLDGLPDLDVPTAQILAALDEGRAGR